MRENLTEFLRHSGLISRCGFSDEDLERFSYQLQEHFLADYLGGMVLAIEDVMNISPSLGWKEILETGARKIVKTLEADAGSIRLYDPESGQMVAFGSHQFREESRTPSISTDDSIAGLVVRSGKSYPVPNISREPRYKDKEVVETLGLNSMIAVPISIPKFFETETEIRGTLQIYYRENDRRFHPLEITHAEVLARRISHVVARKIILDLYNLNLQKERLVEQIFLKLSNREGIKMKDLFGLMVPELVNIIQVHGCALFSVSQDRQTAWLEIGHPAEQAFGEVGRTFHIAEHPYMAVLLEGGKVCEDTETEKIDPAYVLLKDPQNSRLSSPSLISYVRENNLNSILVVPLQARSVTRYFMVFSTSDVRELFSDWEVELLTFFGKEVMQALRMERLDDILHDLKNPAVAIGGFARRARRLLEKDDLESIRDKIEQALDILVEETDRIQSLSSTATIEGRERLVDPGEILKRRFKMNVEASRRRGRRDIAQELGQVDTGLLLYCTPYELERVLDNLLSNATDAVPSEGGVLRASCVRRNANVEITVRNTGSISKEQAEKVRAGEAAGRGLGIIYRFVQSVAGKMDVSNEGGEVVVRIQAPLYSSGEGASDGTG